MSATLETHQALLDEANRLGDEAGKAAASWYAPHDTTFASWEAILRGIRDGDPAVYDTFPSAPLSGEWAGSPTPASVFAELGVDEDYDGADELLAMYEDGFGVAVADTIEGLAILATTNERTLARSMAARFTRRTRDNGTEFVTLTDAAEEWMRDVAREAHGEMLPDDWRYETLASAVEFIADEEDWDDRRYEWADGVTDVYTSALAAWLGSSVQRFAWVDMAREEFGQDDEPLTTWLMRGQYLEACEVFDLVARALGERLP